MQILEQLLHEIEILVLPTIILIVILFYIPYFFSKKARTTFFRLLYFSVAIYLFITNKDSSIIYNQNLIVALALIIPQLGFIVRFIRETIETIKRMTANTYYFFITIYYKILRAINFIKSVFTKIFNLFSGSKRKKEYQDNSYQEKRYYKESKFGSDEKFSSEDNSNYSYKEEQKQSYQEKESNYYKEEKSYSGLDRFDSGDDYIILGVGSDDDLATIKKAYRELMKEYHPDIHPDNKLYEEITQKINSAYANLKDIHKN